MSDYQTFLDRKRRKEHTKGITEPIPTHPRLFEFQRDIVIWALKRGRAAVFSECGTGKTLIQLEWARQIPGPVLILCPLAVAQQTVAEGLNINLRVDYVRDQSQVNGHISITNYEMMEHFDPAYFEGVVLDEAGILKNFMGKTKEALCRNFKNTPFKLNCTATPAPNDYMEIGNQCDFLGVMPSNEMLSRWFINDSMHFGNYRLKGHAIRSFWEWVNTWAICISKPSDLGYDDDGFILPELKIHRHVVQVDPSGTDGELIRHSALNATNMHAEMRLTAKDRAVELAKILSDSDPAEQWILWCNTNYEADEIAEVIPDAVEVRGSDSIDHKIKSIEGFTSGQIKRLISKPSIFGYGLNLQCCANVAFLGLSYSYEEYYQALRRSWRFGQKKPVHVHIIMADTEVPIYQRVIEKADAHEEMKTEMFKAAKDIWNQRQDLTLDTNQDFEQENGEDFTLFRGDSCEVIKEIESDSIDFSIFSPPFANLYIYSDSLRDMGNCQDDEEFLAHFGFLAEDLYRITRPGRLCAVHCKQLVNYANRDGRAGLRDFRGEIIRLFQSKGWQYHSEVCIWKDPVIEMQRTKAQGLLYKQLRSDASFTRQGLPDYLVVFRKWEGEEGLRDPVLHERGAFPLLMWQRYASPVWFDIRQTNVLNVDEAREAKDEKHICPLQLDVIQRAVELWTNHGDIVFSPFAGIGSEGVVSLKMNRKFVGIELKRSYFEQAIGYLQSAKAQTEFKLEGAT